MEKDGLTIEKFRKQCLSKLSSLNFDKHSVEKEKIKLYNFMTDIANDIPYELLVEAEKTIDRKSSVVQLMKYLKDYMLAIELEKGLFEYVLTHVLTKKLQFHYCYPTYLMALDSICRNLDINNKDVNNKTLCPAILKGEINPSLVPFLSPTQIHPKRWLSVLQKKAREEQALSSVSTYDDPENPCKNCGNTKFHSYEQQLRSADEPANKFIICIDCGYTVII
jgi:DNA-directed RNA polymerase subunit M/transcription elongation factor TFIIS